MAGQDVVVTYRADVDDLTQKLKIVIDRMDKLEAESKQAAKGLDTTTKSADKLGKELADVGKTTQKATNDVKGFAKSANTELSGLSNKVSSIGLGLAASLGAAFTVDAVIQFGKASVNAFLEAQENAEKLRFTITQVGGESEAAFERLIDQSAKLQSITIFSDDSIQQAQNALATFGLTSDEITALLPKLADFASATKTDIVQAAQQVGAGLQGAGREFKKYGIEVSATASELDNLSAITEGFAKFQGAAAKETETLTGQLKQQENAADDLQEALGERLAPIFVRLKTVLFEAALGLLGFNKAANDLAQSNIDAVESNIVKSAEKIKAAGGDVVAEYSKRVEEIKSVNAKALSDIESIAVQLNARLIQLSQSKLDVSPENDAQIKSLNAQVDAINKVIEANNLKVKSFQTVIDAEQKASVDAARALTAEQLRLKSITDLNSLLQTNGALNDLLSKKNVTLINAELEARKKLTDQAKKDADVRVSGSAKEIELIKSLSSEYSALFALLSDTDKAKLIELSITGAADLEKDAKEKIRLLTSIFEANKLELPVLVDSEGNVLDFQDQVTVLRTELEANNIEIPVSIDETSLTDFRAKVAELAVQSQAGITIPVKLDVPDDKAATEMNTGIKEVVDSDLTLWFDRNDQILNSSIELFTSLTALLSTFNQAKITAIEDETNQEIAQLDKLSEANVENLDKQRISEREFANQQKKIEEDKVKIQEAADKKIRDLKRKQAIMDKAAALIQITIDTARAYAETIGQAGFAGIPLGLIVLAAGAAQAAIVAAQPIPYEKGTKSAKKGLARVGEKGEEIMYVPGGAKVLPNDKTVTYGSVLDKMFDGTFDKYYMKREIAPRMVAQRKVHEQAKEKSFARNISESIVFNSSLDTNPIAKQLGKGQRITNVNELADAIARRTELSPYRR